MRISVSPRGLASNRCISAPHRHSGNSVDSGSNKFSNERIPPPPITATNRWYSITGALQYFVADPQNWLIFKIGHSSFQIRPVRVKTGQYRQVGTGRNRPLAKSKQATRYGRSPMANGTLASDEIQTPVSVQTHLINANAS